MYFISYTLTFDFFIKWISFPTSYKIRVCVRWVQGLSRSGYGGQSQSGDKTMWRIIGEDKPQRDQRIWSAYFRGNTEGV
jgi:hypothetical protein